jgi:hypothetical protein
MADPTDPYHCPECGGSGCPYCGGPDADYHTMCSPCGVCGGRPPQFDIRSDGRTVWVDAATGYTVARFGPMGVDVHTPDSTGCLDCTHGPTGPAEWDRFVASVQAQYGVTVTDEHRPTHCRT